MSQLTRVKFPADANLRMTQPIFRGSIGVIAFECQRAAANRMVAATVDDIGLEIRHDGGVMVLSVDQHFRDLVGADPRIVDAAGKLGTERILDPLAVRRFDRSGHV